MWLGSVIEHEGKVLYFVKYFKMLRKAPLHAIATNLYKSTIWAVVQSCWEHGFEKPEMNSGFVEAGSRKSISFADWPLVIHTDQNTVCISLQRVNRFICVRTLVCKNQLTTLLPVVCVLSSFKIWRWRTKEKGHASIPAANLASNVWVFAFSKWCAHNWQEFGLMSFFLSNRWKHYLALMGQINLILVTTLPGPI